uniref:Uncharacterized protein n=1 Tax=Bactrocera latifrons TaxID=174628 RepID=A0A0K8UWL2_BACLA
MFETENESKSESKFLSHMPLSAILGQLFLYPRNTIFGVTFSGNRSLAALKYFIRSFKNILNKCFHKLQTFDSFFWKTLEKFKIIMSVPFWRSCCTKTGRTVLINSSSKCPDTGQSSRQFSRNACSMCRDEWNFIRNFGHEMHKNYILMRSLQNDTTYTSKLTECRQPKNVGKCVKRKTNKKADKQARLKVFPSIPFIHNFDFLKTLNYVVVADPEPLSTPKNTLKQGSFENSRCLKNAGKLRPTDNFPMVTPAAFQLAHKLPGCQALAHLPWRGRGHTNWFGHDIGYKVVPKTGAVKLDFVESPAAALPAQNYQAFEPNSIFRLPEDGLRSKTFSKQGKHGALNASPCAERQKRDLRYFNLVCMKGFQPNRYISNLAPGKLRVFGLPVHTGGALQHIPDPRQGNSLSLNLTYAGASDPIQIPGTVADLRSREGFAYNTLNGAPVAGTPLDLRHFLDPEYLNYRVGSRQYHTITAAGDLGSGKTGIHHQGRTPIIAARLGNMEAYRYLARVGAFPQGDVKRNVAAEVVFTTESKQHRKIRPAGGLRSTKPSHYVPFVEMTSGLGNMEAYKYLKHFGAPLYGHFMGAAKDLSKLEDANYLRRIGSTRPTKYLRRASVRHREKYMDDYKQYELEQRRVPTYFGHTQAHENVAGAAVDSGYIGDSGYLRKNSVSRHGKTGSFARYSGQAGVARAAVVDTTAGPRSTDPSKYLVVHRPSINTRQGRGSRRATGLMVHEAPRVMRHTVIPRRKDLSGIVADLAYIRERRLHKRYKLAPEGPFTPFTYTKFPRYIGQTFGSRLVNDHPTNVEAMKFFRRYLNSTQPRQETIKDLRNAQAVKNMRHEAQISEYFKADTFAKRPGKGVGPKYKKRSTHRRKTLNEQEEIFDPQRWADFFAAELGYIFDPGYTGHMYPWFSDFFSDANYGLKDMHNTAVLSTEEQRARERARIHSLNLFYSIINRPGMEMEVSITDESPIPYDYHAKIKEEEKEEKENKKEKRLSLLNVVKLLKDERKKVFIPVSFHEPFDKERPWTWIQNFPKKIPKEILKRLSAETLNSLRAWQRQQTLVLEKSGSRSSPKPKQDIKRRHGNQ